MHISSYVWSGKGRVWEQYRHHPQGVQDLGFDNYEAQISLRDPNDKEKYIGSDEVWEESEAAIKAACEEKGLKARVELGEAAFYGPKLDFMVKDAIGRRWQLGTIQVDYNLPNRFKLEYTAEDNSKKTPVMIHRAPFGSLERFTAVLIEHTAGHFPSLVDTWPSGHPTYLWEV